MDVWLLRVAFVNLDRLLGLADTRRPSAGFPTGHTVSTQLQAPVTAGSKSVLRGASPSLTQALGDRCSIIDRKEQIWVLG